MSDNRVLVVEDEEITGELLRKMLASGGFQVYLYQDGAEALKAYRANPFPVVITDLEMPAMSGDSVIEAIKEINEDQVIIVVTSYGDSATTIINIMKKNVYDYILKPAEPNELVATVKRALETAELRKMKSGIENERVIKLQNQLDWFKWNENIIARNYDRVDLSLFTSLHESFNQGAGFGSLLTLISLISASAKKDNGHYIIDEQMFNLIAQNARVAESILGIFSDLVVIMSRDFELETISAMELYSFIQMAADEVSRFAQIKKMKISLNDPKPGYRNVSVGIEPDNLKKALCEIFINALKFSKPSTSVMVFLDTRSDGLEISVVNSPETMKEGVTGIPFEYENLVIEPFFRMAKIVFEEFETSDYGLGLTLVEKIVRKHGGKITISNVLDSSNIARASETKVSVSVLLPYAEKEGK